ncbi:hypothetical protein HDZ31DRAFT_42526, partial [Schizophyllum fasciatum]
PLQLTLGGPLWRRPKLWRLLLSHASQWGELTWVGSAYNTFPTDAPTMQLPALTSVALEFTRESADEPPPTIPLDLFTCASNVRSLSLTVHEPVIAGLCVPQLWSLTHLRLTVDTGVLDGAQDAALVLRMLQQCRATLESLDVSSTRFHGEVRPVGGVPSPLELPQLTALSLSGGTDWLLAHMRAPALTCLTFYSFIMWQGSAGRLKTLARHSPALRTLRFQAVRRRRPLDDARLVECLQALPDIERVFMSNKGEWGAFSHPSLSIMNFAFLQSMTCAEGAPVVLPNLRELHLEYTRIYPGPDRTSAGAIPPSDELRVAVRAMAMSRQVPQTINGQEIAVLDKFVTDIPGL